MTDLLQQLEKMRSELDTSMKLLRQNGEKLAQAERNYQIIKSQTVMVMKEDGCTMTEIQLSLKGRPSVADAMFERDKAQVMYDANKEHINVVKLEMRVLENQISREWNSNG